MQENHTSLPLWRRIVVGVAVLLAMVVGICLFTAYISLAVGFQANAGAAWSELSISLLALAALGGSGGWL